MEPTLSDGDYVLIDAEPLPSPHGVPRVGQIVVAREPRVGRILVKRVRSLGNATVALGSDDPTAGRDSRHFGSVPLHDVLGRVTLAYRAGA